MIIKKGISAVSTISIIATSVALLGAAAAPYIDPAHFEWTAFLGLMYPFLLLLHLLLFACNLIIKRSAWSLLFLLPAFATIHLFLNSFGLNYFSSTRQTKGDTLKFMTYNVHMFTYASDLATNAQPAMLQLIQSEQPEVLCMQDFQLKTGIGKQLNTIDSIKTILKTTYYYDGPDNANLFPTQSIVTFSKYPIVNSGFILFSAASGGNQCVFTDIKKNGRIIRVYNVHFESLGFPQSAYREWANADIVGKFKFLYNVKDRFAMAFANRSRQVRLVKKHAASCPYPFIIAGDFNDTPSSYAVNYTMKGMKNAFREKGRGYKVTYNGGLPDFQIDYVLVQPYFRVLNYNIIQKKLSDHFPVIVTLSIN